MKRRFLISMLFSMICVALFAQSSHNSRVMKNFTDSLRELSASYFAYHRMWDDLDAPGPPKSMKLKSDYYKLFVPPTYYFAPLEQALAIEWEPSNHLGMTACDSLAQAKGIKTLVYEIPDMQKIAAVDRWVNKILLGYYLEHPNQVIGNEMYFADAILLDDVQVINAPRQEKMKNYMQVVNPVEKASADAFKVLKPNFWKKSAAASVQFSQYGISDNWYQGGESTNALLAETKLVANYDDRQKVQFENSLELKIGFITAPSDTVHTWKTNADLLRLYSKLGIQAVKNLFYTIDAKLSTQFFPNYKTNTNDLVSAFLSPVQFETSIGMDFKLDKSKYKLSLMGAPFSYTFVYIKNDDIVNPSSFNVEPGHTSANLFGSKITANLDWKIAKDISYVTKLEYFTTYDKVIANWENTFNFQLNRYLSTKLFIHLRYDDGVTLTEENKSYFQLKEMLTFGLSYTW